MHLVGFYYKNIQCVPLATEPGISVIILPLMRILQRNLKRTSDTFLSIFHATNVLLFKFRCNNFIGVRIIKEMPGSVASGTYCITMHSPRNVTFTKSHSLEDWLWKTLGICSKTDCVTMWIILAHYFSYHNNSPYANTSLRCR